MDLNIPEIYEPLWKKEARYYFLRGGRGSGKSWAVADWLLIALVRNPDLNLVCLREVQKSIKHSSKKLLADRINTLCLNEYFDVLLTEIRLKHGRGIIIFNGLQDHTVDSIKSLEGFSLCWVEEAQTITSHSLELLIPTIRAEKSKMFFTYNPKNETDAIELLRDDKENKVVIHSTYLDNHFAPSTIYEEAEEMRVKRPQKYNHIYMGQYGQAEGLVFDKVESRVIREDEVKGLECVQGLDFGYTNDPTAFCVNYIDHNNKIFYVFDGFYKKGLLNNQIAYEIKKLLAHKHIIFADSAEPKSIDTLKFDGITRIRSAIKGKDSINAGIDYLLDFHIVINSHLVDFIDEANNYTWAIDKNTNKPTNKPVDAHNHFWDSCRYSISDKVKKTGKTASFKIGLI
jgi:phage terminase large subunit